MKLTSEDFVPDPSTVGQVVPARRSHLTLLEGVELMLLSSGSDERGTVNELLTERGGRIEPIVHVYQVHAAPGSVRAWVFHRLQSDRLAFTNGNFRIVLYDLRPGSRTYRQLNILDVGEAHRCLLVIPSLVAHGVQNRGREYASFVNLPTRAYDPARPDKWRLSPDHPLAPYRFTSE